LRHDFLYPDKFVRFELFQHYARALKLLGEFLHCSYQDLAIVDNATTAVNTVLRSYPFKPGDKIVYHSTIYEACLNTLRFLQERSQVELVKVELNYPLTPAEVVDRYEQAFIEHKPVMAIFDTVTSMPGVSMPFEQLVKLCRTYSVLSLIDGAHSIGMFPLSLGQLKPDFYTSNLHKWLFVPRGCAVLYINKLHHHKIHTMPVSHSYLPDDTKLSIELEQNWVVDRFAFIGTKSFAAMDAIEFTIKFRQNECGGEDNIHQYCYRLAKEVGELVSGKWKTSVLDCNAMVTVEMPYSKAIVEQVKPNFRSILESVSQEMIYKHKTFVPFIIHNDKLYARFSCQIYNDLNDYKYSSDLLIRILNRTLNEFKL